MNYARVFAPEVDRTGLQKGATVLKEVITFAADSEGTYAELFAVAFPSIAKNRCDVVGFTSAHRGAGVSFISASVAERLAAATNGQILLISASVIELFRKCTLDVIQRAIRSNVLGNLAVVLSERTIEHVELRDSVRYERSVAETIDLLRSQFRSVVIDIPSVMHSDLAVRYASSTDAMVLVVQAGRTKRREMVISCRRLQSAKGRIAGLLCNKRQYLIPRWLYNYLD